MKASSVSSAISSAVTVPRRTAVRAARLNMHVALRTAWCQYTFRYIWYLAKRSDSSALTVVDGGDGGAGREIGVQEKGASGPASPIWYLAKRSDSSALAPFSRTNPRQAGNSELRK